MMRSVAFFLVCSALISCTQRTAMAPETQREVQANSPTLPVEESAVTATPVSNDFNPVKKMLGTNCAPCHNPGGKMYERLPFDNEQVVRAHAEKIAGRLKGPDIELLNEFIRRSPAN